VACKSTEYDDSSTPTCNVSTCSSRSGSDLSFSGHQDSDTFYDIGTGPDFSSFSSTNSYSGTGSVQPGSHNADPSCTDTDSRTFGSGSETAT
jgi:hypothetical protein